MFRLQLKQLGVKVSSEQCEIEGIIFGTVIALKYFVHNCEDSYGECVYILCDCQKGIDTLTVHHELVKHPKVIGKVHHIEEQLNERSVVIKIVKIQGRSGIKGNEHADMEARQAVKKLLMAK